MTFQEEITLLWKRKWSLVTLIMLLNRYGLLLYGTLALSVTYVGNTQVRLNYICCEGLHLMYWSAGVRGY